MEDSFDVFVGHVGKLSKVKRLLLSTLWESSSDFPKKWVKSNDLLNLTKQKYFDRRLRELRDQGGFDISSQVIDGEHCWRLNSKTIANGVNRTYLTTAQKETLFSKTNFSCAICNKQTDAGIRGLQADHKVPLSRGGTEQLENWQPICNQCNVAKRRACQGCELKCSECSWAYPERIDRRIVVSLPIELSQLMKSEPDSKLEALIVTLLTSHLTKVK